jgi:hypothetical protein
MDPESNRYVEFRPMVIVVVDLTEPELADVCDQSGARRVSLVNVVSSEIQSNCESLRYIKSVVVSVL